jgi:hypothetical protein
MVGPLALASSPDWDAVKHLFFGSARGVWTNAQVDTKNQKLIRSAFTLRKH